VSPLNFRSTTSGISTRSPVEFNIAIAGKGMIVDGQEHVARPKNFAAWPRRHHRVHENGRDQSSFNPRKVALRQGFATSNR